MYLNLLYILNVLYICIFQLVRVYSAVEALKTVPKRSQIVLNDADTEFRKRIEPTSETGHEELSIGGLLYLLMMLLGVGG